MAVTGPASDGAEKLGRGSGLKEEARRRYLADAGSNSTVSCSKAFRGGERCRRPAAAALASWTPLARGHVRHPDLGSAVLGPSLAAPGFTAPVFRFSGPPGQGGQREMDREYGPSLLSVHSGPAPSIPEADSRFTETAAHSGARMQSSPSPDRTHGQLLRVQSGEVRQGPSWCRAGSLGLLLSGGEGTHGSGQATTRALWRYHVPRGNGKAMMGAIPRTLALCPAVHMYIADSHESPN